MITQGDWKVQDEFDEETGENQAVVYSELGEATTFIADCGSLDCEEVRENAHAISAIPLFIKLAREVAKEYTDAADWKDAIGLIQDLAWDAIRKSRIEMGVTGEE